MNSIKQYLAPIAIGIVGAIVAGAGSYGLVAAYSRDRISPSPIPAQSPADSAPARSTIAQSLNSGTQQVAVTTANTLALDIYRADSLCQALLPQTATVPAERSVDAAVRLVLEQANSADFDLAGYRIDVNTGVATVELRRAPDTRRQFASLSTCEQFALFGSLRKTLVDNPQLNIQQVRFTEQGRDIAL
jgi:hypothetical protein